jgi:hypothetical protein
MHISKAVWVVQFFIRGLKNAKNIGKRDLTGWKEVTMWNDFRQQ